MSSELRKQPDFWVRGSGKAVLRAITPERDDHENIVKLLEWKARPGVLFFHPHNEFWLPNTPRNQLARAWERAKARGARAGASDLVLVWTDSARRICVLFLEIKREDGTQSKAQQQFEADAVVAGAMYALCYGYDEAAALLERLGILK